VECENSNRRGSWNHLKIIQKIPAKHEIKEVQKTAILDTAHIFRKVLMEKYLALIMGKSTPMYRGHESSMQGLGEKI
jgi:hypothetical protein